MKKIVKGQPGYLDQQKKIEIIKTCISFVLIICILVLGYIQTGTKLNWLTFVAVLSCLPAAKLLAGVITRMPHKSVSEVLAADVEAAAPRLTTAYDLVLTSYERIMPIDCVLISSHTVCGYTHSKKIDLNYTSRHIKQMLGQNHLDGISVKIFTEYETFLTRAEGMENIAAVEQPDQDREMQIRQVILNISL